MRIIYTVLTLPIRTIYCFSFLLEVNSETCEEERSILRRRLAASAVEIERWVKWLLMNILSILAYGVYFHCKFVINTYTFVLLIFCVRQRMKCFPWFCRDDERLVGFLWVFLFYYYTFLCVVFQVWCVNSSETVSSFLSFIKK